MASRGQTEGKIFCYSGKTDAIKAAMKLKQKAVAPLMLGVAAGLGICGVVAYGVIQQRQPLASELPFGAGFVPQEAIATVSLTTDERLWGDLQQYGNAASRQTLNDTLTKWRDRLLTANSLTYDEHIKPWIGDEVTLAFLPVDQEATADVPASNPLQQQTPVLLVPIADLAVAQETFETLVKPDGESYKGVVIRTLTGGGGVFHMAVLNPQVLAVSPDSQAVQQVIDTSKGEPSTIDTEGYGQAFKQVVVEQPFARIYVNGPTAKEAAIATSIRANPFWGITPIQNNQGMAISSTLEPNGLRFQGINWLPADSAVQYKPISSPQRLPAMLPDDTLLMVSGANVQQLWQGFEQQTDAPEGSLASPAILQQAIRNITGLDPETEFLSWMTGEFALALTAQPAVGGSVNAPTVTLMAQTNDRPQAEESLKKLDAVMADRYRYSVSGAPTGEQDLVKWISPFGSLSAQRGWKSENIAFLQIGAGAADAPPPQTLLSDSDSYQAAIASDLNDINGMFYANVSRLRRDGAGLPLLSVPAGLEPYLNGIQALGVTTKIQDNRSTRFELNVLIPPDMPAETP